MKLLPKEIVKAAMRLLQMHDFIPEYNERMVFRFAIMSMFLLLLDGNETALEGEDALRNKLLEFLKEGER